MNLFLIEIIFFIIISNLFLYVLPRLLFVSKKHFLLLIEQIHAEVNPQLIVAVLNELFE